MKKLILRNFQSPGDIVMLTAAVRDLHRCYPGEFLTDVRTSCPELWENNPYLSQGSAPDENRTAELEYDLDDQVVLQRIKNAVTGDQESRYVYGTSLEDSGLASARLLRAVIYPDSEDTADPLGAGPDGVYDRVEFRYNRQGEMTEKKDQRETVHAYEYDKLGRQVHDRVVALGGGVNGPVRRISRSYDVRGLLVSVSSHDDENPGGGTVLNEVSYAHNDFGLAVSEKQAHEGSAGAGTPAVEYDYADGGANHTRLLRVEYPGGRRIDSDYGASGGMNDRLSRLSGLKDGSQELVGYEYLGLGGVVRALRPEPDVALTYLQQSGEPIGDGGDPYTGLDRFGRVIKQRWIRQSDETALEDLSFAYDRAGNRLDRTNHLSSAHSENYLYDGLYQLKDFQRVGWNEAFTYDPIGNWEAYQADGLQQSRTHNKANEIEEIDGSEEPIAHDPAGNTSKAPKPGDWSSGYELEHDAWSRLVKVKAGGSVVESYRYDGLDRRIVKENGTKTHYYYSSDWQILEERTGNSQDPEREYVWGATGLNDLLLRERDSDGDGNLDERLYALNDTMNITACIEPSSAVKERYGYDAFGSPRFMDAGFSEKSTSSCGWEILFHGHLRDPGTGLYQMRYRYQHPGLGRFLNRDPIQEAGGLNLYGFVGNDPVNRWDYLGLYDPFPFWPPGYGPDDRHQCRRTNKPNPEYEPEPNGCGAENGINVPDNWHFGSFKDACDAHDICYGTCGNDRKDCDKQFLEDMLSVCRDKKVFSGDCHMMARVYYRVVRWRGRGAYESAQDDACLWECCN